MFALNHLTLLLYERVPVPSCSSGDKRDTITVPGDKTDKITGPGDKTSWSAGPDCGELDLVSLVECSVEQGVFSACSLPSSDVIRASVFTATISISTDGTGMCHPAQTNLSEHSTHTTCHKPYNQNTVINPHDTNKTIPTKYLQHVSRINQSNTVLTSRVTNHAIRTQ